MADDTPPKPSRVAFYFSAHEDDWQLFMTPSAFHDVRDPNTRCVFVHMTAGDAGLGTGRGGRKHPLYLARENGAERAIRFIADSDGAMPCEPAIDRPRHAGHAVRRIIYRNTITYFLRLPDGNPEGGGYEITGFQSLKRLAEGACATMIAIDGSASYQGWCDFIAMLRALIAAEAGDVTVALHVPDDDATLNPGDHADHRFTAVAVRDAAGSTPARFVHHIGYAGGDRAENLAGAERDLKCAIYAVTMAGVLALDHPVAWQHYDALYVGRDYWRET